MKNKNNASNALNKVDFVKKRKEEEEEASQNYALRNTWLARIFKRKNHTQNA